MAKIIGTASVKVTSDTTGFGTSAGRGIKRDLEQSIKGNELDPGLDKVKGDVEKFGAQLNSIFAGIWKGVKSGAVAGLVSIAPQVANALVPLLGALGLVPGAVGIAGAALGTLVIGLHGFGAALKDAGDPKKFATDLKGLAPSAREAAQAFASLRGPFKDLQLDVQDRLFQGLATRIRSVALGVLPVLRTGLGSVATALGNAGEQFLAFLGSASAKTNLGTLFGSATTGVQNFAAAVRPVATAVLTVMAVSSQAVARLTSTFGDLGNQFNAFIQRVAGNGDLLNWIEQGVSQLFVLGDIFRNVASIIFTVLKGLDATGGTFLDTLSSLTFQLSQFLKSAQGQAALKAIGQAMAAIGQSIGPVFLALLQAAAQVLVAISPVVQELAKQVGADLVKAIQALTPLLVGVATWLGNNASTAANLAVVFGGLFVAFKVFSVIGTAIKIFRDLRETLLLLAGAETIAEVATAGLDVVLGILLSPVTLVVAAVAAVAAVAFLVVKNWGAISRFLSGVWNAIAGVAKAVWGGIASFFTDIWGAITSALTTAWNSVVNFTRTVWNAITSFLIGAWNAILNATRPIWEPIVTIISDVFSIIQSIITIVVVGIVDLILLAWRGIVVAASAIWNALAVVLTAIWTAILAVFHAVWDPLAAFFSVIWRGIQVAATAVWGVISAFLRVIWSGIVAAARAVWAPLGAFLSVLWNGIKAAASAIWGAVSGVLRAVWGAIVSVARTIFSPIANFFRSAWEAASGAVRTVVGSIFNFVKGIPGTILRALGNLGSILFNAGKSIIEGLLNGIKNALGGVKDFLQGVANKIVGWKGPPDYDATILISNGELIMQGLINGMANKLDPLKQFLGGVTDTITSSLTGTSASVDIGANFSATGTPGTGGAMVLNQTNNMLPGISPQVFAQQSAQAMGRQLASGSTVIATTPQNPTPGMTNNLLSTGSLT